MFLCVNKVVSGLKVCYENHKTKLVFKLLENLYLDCWVFGKL